MTFILRIIRGSLLLLSLSGCLPQFFYSKNAEPVQKTVELIETSEVVSKLLGSGVSVSLAVTKRFDRDLLRAKLQGMDHVYLLTKVKGSKGEAWLDLNAKNINNQGWAGRFKLTAIGQQVLIDDEYRVINDSEILQGSYEPDGSPVIE